MLLAVSAPLTQNEQPAHLHISQCASACTIEQNGSHLMVAESSSRVRAEHVTPVSSLTGQNLQALHLQKSQ